MYGVNIESITVVVAAFMVGLGLGSLLGGVISRMVRFPLPVAFGLVELGIGAYGFRSLAVFDWAAELTAGAPAAQTFLFSFALVVVPTVCMGATLPILVAFVVRRSRNVGRSVGTLYFANTLGAAVACLVVAFWLFAAFGMSGSVNLAAAFNVVVGIGALLFHFIARTETAPATEHNGPGEMIAAAATVATPLPLALVLVSLAGFISLSYEILWARIYSFTSAGHPASFPLVSGVLSRGHCHGRQLQPAALQAVRGRGQPASLACNRVVRAGCQHCRISDRARPGRKPSSAAFGGKWTLLLVFCSGRSVGSDVAAPQPLLHPGERAGRSGAQLSLYRQHHGIGGRQPGHGVRAAPVLVTAAYLGIPVASRHLGERGDLPSFRRSAGHGWLPAWVA